MRRQLEGSRAVAEAIALCRPEVIAAYPISPQTHIVETLADLVRSGELTPCEYLLVESPGGPFMLDTVGNQTLDPEPQGSRRNREPHRGDLPRALTSPGATRPGEKRDEGPGAPGLIAVVEMITAGIIEIDRELHQPQPEHAGVKIEIALWIARNGGDVMDSHSS